jgi:ribosomal-protein-alanine acetyltransferase
MNADAVGLLVRRMRAADLEQVMALAASLKDAPQWPRAAYVSALDKDSTPRRIALVAEDVGQKVLAADRLEALKGHGFSRVIEQPEKAGALAPEGTQAVVSTFPQGLKPKVFSVQPAARLKPRPFKAGAPSDRSLSMGWKAGAPSDGSLSMGWKTVNFAAPKEECSPADDAVKSGRVVGFLIASVLAPQVELESIAVSMADQRRGIGRKLFFALVEKLRAAEAREFLLEVRASNEKALGFYRSLGWSEAGRRPRYYADPEEDAVLMSLGLG